MKAALIIVGIGLVASLLERFLTVNDLEEQLRQLQEQERVLQTKRDSLIIQDSLNVIKLHAILDTVNVLKAMVIKPVELRGRSESEINSAINDRINRIRARQRHDDTSDTGH